MAAPSVLLVHPYILLTCECRGRNIFFPLSKKLEMPLVPAQSEDLEGATHTQLTPQWHLILQCNNVVAKECLGDLGQCLLKSKVGKRMS